VKEKKTLDIKRSPRAMTTPQDTPIPNTDKKTLTVPEGFKHIHWIQASITIALAIIALWSAYFVTRLLSTPVKSDNKINPASQTTDKKTTETNSTNLQDNTPKTDNPFAPVATTDAPANNTSPTDTQTPPAKNSFKIRILNGNGVTGDASRLKADLLAKGYNVGDTGNARLKYTKTQVYYVAGQKDQADLVSQDLTGKQTVESEAQADLVGTDYQVLIVIGKS
jgi:hypothetical protein